MIRDRLSHFLARDETPGITSFGGQPKDQAILIDLLNSSQEHTTMRMSGKTPTPHDSGARARIARLSRDVPANHVIAKKVLPQSSAKSTIASAV